MFCPKCGAVLESRWDAYVQRDVLCCVPGDMPMSANVTDKLMQRFGPPSSADTPQSPLPAYSALLHGGCQWYCPGCGIRLNDHLECTRCGHHLRDLMFILVELHPHRGEIPSRG